MGFWSAFRKRGLKNFEFLEKIDEGEMSTIYRAVDLRDQKTVCLKLLSSAAVRLREALLSRFPQTDNLLLSINHPNLVRTFEFGHDRGRHYISSEFVSGVTLFIVSRRKSFSLSKLLDYFLHVAEGLRHLHENVRLVHRDFNHHNVIIDENDACKILDLDFAFPISSNTSGIFRRSGTLGYLAPEQVRGKDLDHRVDIYAFGASLYEAIVGENPFRDTSGESFELRRERTLANHLSLVPTPPSRRRSDVPPLLDELILQCLRHDSRERFQSMSEVQALLRRIRENLP